MNLIRGASFKFENIFYKVIAVSWGETGITSVEYENQNQNTWYMVSAEDFYLLFPGVFHSSKVERKTNKFYQNPDNSLVPAVKEYTTFNNKIISLNKINP
jgi:hypothetical protein